MDFEKLPSDYKYLLLKNEKDLLEFRVKEITDGASAKNWIARMSQQSKTTWRIKRTYPETDGRYNIFKIDMRCQYSTDRRVRGIRHSKNTDCPASLRVVVKRYVKYSRSKNIDYFTKDWPTICTFKSNHNHAIESATALQYFDMSEESQESFSLFRKGDNASSAVQCLKTELLFEVGDEDYQIEADSLYVPLASTSKERDDCPESNNLHSSNDILLSETLSGSSTEINVTKSETLSESELMEFDELVLKIKEGCQNEPDIFVPAMKKMLKNARTAASTQKGLISAMHTFGLYNCASKKLNKRNHRQQIGVTDHI